MKKSLYRQVMFVISSICLILLITIAVKIGVFSELTSCVWIESILSVINNSYFSGVLCSIIAVCIFRKNRALAPHERSAVPLGTDHCPVG